MRGIGRGLCFSAAPGSQPHGARIPEERAVAAVSLIEIHFADHLIGRMHRQHGDARIDHVHAVFGAQVGDGAASSQVYTAQLRGLEGDASSSRMRRRLAMYSAFASLEPDLPRLPVYLLKQMPRPI